MDIQTLIKRQNDLNVRIQVAEKEKEKAESEKAEVAKKLLTQGIDVESMSKTELELKLRELESGIEAEYKAIEEEILNAERILEENNK